MDAIAARDESEKRDPTWTKTEWDAFWRIGQITEIAEPGFWNRVKIAREEGLLEAILADQAQVVQERAKVAIAALSERIRLQYRPIQFLPAKSGGVFLAAHLAREDLSGEETGKDRP